MKLKVVVLFLIVSIFSFTGCFAVKPKSIASPSVVYSDMKLDNAFRYEVWCKYDENGNLISYKDSEELNFSCEYKSNKIIYEKHDDGFEVSCEYKEDLLQRVTVKKLDNVNDINNWKTVIDRKAGLNFSVSTDINNKNYDLVYDYDKNNKLIHCKDNMGGELVNEYDTRGNLIKQATKVNQYTDEKVFKYNSNNNLIEDNQSSYGYNERGMLIYKKDKNDFWGNNEIFYKYDKNGNEIYSNSGLYETYYAYDWNGNMIHSLMFASTKHVNSIDGREPVDERINIYDKNGNILYKKMNNEMLGVQERICEYDDYNNLIHQKDSDGFEVWIEYGYDLNNRVVHKIEYRTEAFKRIIRKITMPFITIEKYFDKENLGNSYNARMIQMIELNIK